MAGRGLTAEFLLVAACCRWPPSEIRNSAVRAAAANIIDWDDFLRVVRRQRVFGLVHDALRSAAIDCPTAVAGELASRMQRTARWNLTLAAETNRLQRMLAAANIPVLVLKGVALAQLAYGSLRLKHSRDIDLLVPPECVEAALRLVERDAYALVLPAQELNEPQRAALVRYGREVELVHRGSKVRIELQWRLVDNPMLLQGINVHSPTQSVCIGDGASVRTLAEEDLFAALCVHGAVHAWARLKWLADLNALIAANDADLMRLYRHAQDRGAGLCAGQALLLCHRLFDLRLPPALADEIRTNERVGKLAAIALAAMTTAQPPTEGDPGFVGVARGVLNQFLLGQGPAFFMAQCRVASVGPADIIRWPLPRPLHFLYPLLRIPLWLWRRTMLRSGWNKAIGFDSKNS
jgi:Uncharacterised nucleotidyltransferase